LLEASDSGVAKSFLILCDKRLEKPVRDLVVRLSDDESGSVIIQTIEDVPPKDRSKKYDFGKRLETKLNGCHAVVLVSSENLALFIDEKKSDNLPALLNDNHAVSHEKLDKFFKDQVQKIKPKIISISLDGDKTLPTTLKGHLSPIVKEKDKEDVFDKRLRSEIAAHLNR